MNSPSFVPQFAGQRRYADIMRAGKSSVGLGGVEAMMWIQIAIMVIAAVMFAWRIVGLLAANAKRQHHR
ncbi:MAG: hypothetical protein J2O49_04310 [Sciscionella sp.]|nr:hypothetical protein [Sciscionella sp.]